MNVTFQEHLDTLIVLLSQAQNEYAAGHHAATESLLFRAHHELVEAAGLNDKVLGDKVTPLRRVAMEAGKKEASHDAH